MHLCRETYVLYQWLFYKCERTTFGIKFSSTCMKLNKIKTQKSRKPSIEVCIQRWVSNDKRMTVSGDRIYFLRNALFPVKYKIFKHCAKIKIDEKNKTFHERKTCVIVLHDDGWFWNTFRNAFVRQYLSSVDINFIFHDNIFAQHRASFKTNPAPNNAPPTNDT